jgi:hypothetical protein
MIDWFDKEHKTIHPGYLRLLRDSGYSKEAKAIQGCNKWVSFKKCNICGNETEIIISCQKQIFCPLCAEREIVKSARWLHDQLDEASRNIGEFRLGMWVFTLPKQYFPEMDLTIRKKLEKAIKLGLQELYGDIGFRSNFHMVGDEVDGFHPHLDVIMPEITIEKVVKVRTLTLDMEEYIEYGYKVHKHNFYHNCNSKTSKVRKTLIKHVLKAFPELKTYRNKGVEVMHDYKAVYYNGNNIGRIINRLKYSWRRPSQFINDAYLHNRNVNPEVARKLLGLPRYYRHVRGFGQLGDRRIKEFFMAANVAYETRADFKKRKNKELCCCEECGHNDWCELDRISVNDFAEMLEAGPGNDIPIVEEFG